MYAVVKSGRNTVLATFATEAEAKEAAPKLSIENKCFTKVLPVPEKSTEARVSVEKRRVFVCKSPVTGKVIKSNGTREDAIAKSKAYRARYGKTLLIKIRELPATE